MRGATRTLAIVAVLTFASGTSGEGTEHKERSPALAAHPTQQVVIIRMVDNGETKWRFEPDSVQVQRGDIVRFIQDDIAPHNVQFKDVPDAAKLEPTVIMGPFLIQKGATYEIEIDERFAAGSYHYVCTPHEIFGMKATIDVVTTDAAR